MPLESHALIKEFPELRDRIHQMKISNHHFARLFSAYDAIEHDVHRIESGAQASSDSYLEDLKKKRLMLKDELFKMLQPA